jgi:hypothetical protein
VEDPYFERVEVPEYGLYIPRSEHAYNTLIRYFACERRVAADWYKPEVFDLLRQLLPQETRVLNLHEVKVNPNSSCGPFMSKLFTTTRDYLAAFPLASIREAWFAHVLDLDMWWAVRPKVEILPSEKIQEKRPRTFIFQDIPFRIAQAAWVQDFNEKMKIKTFTSGCYIGFNRYSGNFSQLARELDKFRRKIMADVRQWDARFGRQMAAICAAARYMAMMGNTDSVLFWAYYYGNLLWSKLVLWDGQAMVKPEGMDSGSDTTGHDNTIGHMYIFLSFIREWCLRRGIDFTRRNVDKYWFFAIYGDDIIAACDDFDEEDERLLYAAYVRMNMTLKPDATKVSDDLEGMVFLGGRFKRHPQHGWVHGFDVQKCLASGRWDERELTPAEAWNKHLALATLVYWELGTSSLHHQALLRLRKQFESDPTFLQQTGGAMVPKAHDYEAHWMGWEGKGGKVHFEDAKAEEICLGCEEKAAFAEASA